MSKVLRTDCPQPMNWLPDLRKGLVRSAEFVGTRQFWKPKRHCLFDLLFAKRNISGQNASRSIDARRSSPDCLFVRVIKKHRDTSIISAVRVNRSMSDGDGADVSFTSMAQRDLTALSGGDQCDGRILLQAPE